MEVCLAKGMSTLTLYVFPFQLPLHCAFLRRIDLGLFIDWKRLVEEESLDVIEQEILRVGAGKIQTVMIDYLRLFL